jgi:two-component system, NarL family, nitrate/nitrite response regulator NarL
MSDKIHLVIVDDHPLFREGVVNTLRAEPGLEVVGQGTTAEDAIRLVGDLLPDLILLDLTIPGGGMNAAQAIATACPVTKIVILTASEEEDHVVLALKTGARAYILKGVSARELVSILRAVGAGAGYVPPALAARLLAELTGGATARPVADTLSELTEREYQILERVAAGCINKEIAQQLSLSEKTVKHYMTNILQKLQVRNRVEAALLAQKYERMRQKGQPEHLSPKD